VRLRNLLSRAVWNDVVAFNGSSSVNRSPTWISIGKTETAAASAFGVALGLAVRLCGFAPLRLTR
jgi:hypothetical protein